MFRINLGLIIGGVVLAFYGVQEYRVSMGTSTAPESVSLQFVEMGQVPENNHVLFGEHVADYDGTVYEYEEGTGRVTHAYYPIVSESHPFFAELSSLEARYPDVNDAPDEEWPMIDNFKVLVKTKRFKTEDSIPDGMYWEDEVQGMVINLVESMDREEKKLIKEAYPELNMEQLLIVEDGRKPTSSVQSLGMVGGGGILSLLGLSLFFFGGMYEGH